MQFDVRTCITLLTCVLENARVVRPLLAKRTTFSIILGWVGIRVRRWLLSPITVQNDLLRYGQDSAVNGIWVVTRFGLIFFVSCFLWASCDEFVIIGSGVLPYKSVLCSAVLCEFLPGVLREAFSVSLYHFFCPPWECAPIFSLP